MISICFRHNTMVLYVPFLDGKHGEVLFSFLIPPFSLKVLHLVVVFCSCSVMEREEREENERQKTEEWVVGWAAKGWTRKRWNGATHNKHHWKSKVGKDCSSLPAVQLSSNQFLFWLNHFSVMHRACSHNFTLTLFSSEGTLELRRRQGAEWSMSL